MAPVDSPGEPSLLVDTGFPANSPDWSPDGRYIVFAGPSGEETGPDIQFAEVNEAGQTLESKVLIGTAANEGAPKFSPDARFVTYVSDESGRLEVYVCTFPTGAGKRLVSGNGGTQPRWRSDGKELFYVENHKTMMAVPVELGSIPVFGPPQRLFDSPDFNFRSQPYPMYDISADGQRFLTATRLNPNEPPLIRIVENWFEEFRDRQR